MYFTTRGRVASPHWKAYDWRRVETVDNSACPDDVTSCGSDKSCECYCLYCSFISSELYITTLFNRMGEKIKEFYTYGLYVC